MSDITRHDSTDVQVESSTSPFDKIRHVRPDGTEYWCARELAPELGYAKWDRVGKALKRAKASCVAHGLDPADHFRGTTNMVDIGSGAERAIADVHLTRIGCYLVAVNGDPRKPEVADAQHYFLMMTRIAEILGLVPQVAPVQDQPAIAAETSDLTRQEALAEGRPGITSRIGVLARNQARLKEDTIELKEANVEIARNIEAIPMVLDLYEVVNDKVDMVQQALLDRIIALEQTASAAPKDTPALTYLGNVPRATEPPAPLKTRKKINRLVRRYARTREVPYADVWNDCYVELRDRYEFDARRLAKKAGKKPLDVVEEAGLMEEFFKVVTWYVKNDGVIT